MAYQRHETESEEQIANAIDNVLEEDRRQDCAVRGTRGADDEVNVVATKSDDFNEDPSVSSVTDTISEEDDQKSPESCRVTAEFAKNTFCCCDAKVLSRFSVLVMEALRSLQRNVDAFPTSNVEDIVNHIEQNYQTDGDVYAQSLTALKQVCSQGFVIEVVQNEYHLIGPVANSVNEASADRADCIPMKDSSKSSNQREKCKQNYTRRNGCNFAKRKLNFSNSQRNTMNKSAKCNDCNENFSFGEKTQSIEDNYGCVAKQRKNGRNFNNSRGRRVRCITEGCQQNSSARARNQSRENQIVRRNRIAEEDSSMEESENTDDQYFQQLFPTTPNHQNKTHVEDLKEWIQHCREECKRRARNRQQI